jgi:hypothetical protein
VDEQHPRAEGEHDPGGEVHREHPEREHRHPRGRARGGRQVERRPDGARVQRVGEADGEHDGR